VSTRFQTKLLFLLLRVTRHTTLLLAPKRKASWNQARIRCNAVLAVGLPGFNVITRAHDLPRDVNIRPDDKGGNPAAKTAQWRLAWRFPSVITKAIRLRLNW